MAQGRTEDVADLVGIGCVDAVKGRSDKAYLNRGAVPFGGGNDVRAGRSATAIGDATGAVAESVGRRVAGSPGAEIVVEAKKGVSGAVAAGLALCAHRRRGECPDCKEGNGEERSRSDHERRKTKVEPRALR